MLLLLLLASAVSADDLSVSVPPGSNAYAAYGVRGYDYEILDPVNEYEACVADNLKQWDTCTESDVAAWPPTSQCSFWMPDDLGQDRAYVTVRLKVLGSDWWQDEGKAWAMQSLVLRNAAYQDTNDDGDTYQWGARDLVIQRPMTGTTWKGGVADDLSAPGLYWETIATVTLPNALGTTCADRKYHYVSLRDYYQRTTHVKLGGGSILRLQVADHYGSWPALEYLGFLAVDFNDDY